MDEPSAARIYDAYLGGSKTTQADRQFAADVAELIPDASQLARENRMTIFRAVRWVVGQGVGQVIDLGSGVPSQGSIHSAARSVDPDARVLYVDFEGVAYRALLDSTTGDPGLGVVRADVRNVDGVLGAQVTAGLLDLAKPVVLVMGALLHFLSDEQDPAGLLTAYREAVAPGSYLIITHDTAELGREAEMTRFAQMYKERVIPMYLRDHNELAQLLRGFTVLDPGIVPMPLLVPDPANPYQGDPWNCVVYAAIART